MKHGNYPAMVAIRNPCVLSNWCPFLGSLTSASSLNNAAASWLLADFRSALNDPFRVVSVTNVGPGYTMSWIIADLVRPMVGPTSEFKGL